MAKKTNKINTQKPFENQKKSTSILYWLVFLFLTAGYASPSFSKTKYYSSDLARINAAFLKKTIGAEVEISLEPAEKSSMQLFWEGMLNEYPRRNAPGRWIDDIPDTQPTKPDISPQLPDEILYYDNKEVENHWDAFCQRNPKTAEYLKERITLPVLMIDMPKRYWSYGLMANYINKRKQEVARNTSASSHDYFQKLTRILLYADFLIARGDNKAKEWAAELLEKVISSFRVALTTVDKENDRSLYGHVAEEILWPLLDIEEGRYNEYVCSMVIGGIQKKYENIYEYLKQPDYIHAVKWRANRTLASANRRQLMFTNLSNVYGTQDDYLGMLLCSHAAHHTGRYCNVTFDYMSRLFEKLCGKEEGKFKFKAYLKKVSRDTNHPLIDQRILRVSADFFIDKNNYPAAIKCLRKMDPKNKNIKIRKEIRQLTNKARSSYLKGNSTNKRMR